MSLTSEQNEYIKDLYELSGHNANKATSLFYDKFGFNVSPPTIRIKWGEYGFSPMKKKGHTDEEYKSLFIQHDGDLEKIAEELDCKINSVLLRLKHLGLISTTRRREKNSEKPTKGKYAQAFAFLSPLKGY